MKARIMGREIEVDEKRMRGAVVGTPSGTRHGSTGRSNRIPDNVRDGVQAGSNPAPSSYKSKWEERYAKQLAAEKVQGVIVAWWYQPFSMWLPGGVRYKPDFMVQYPHSERLQMVEIKGWSKNLRDGITRLKVAASIFPCFDWSIGRWKGGKFEFDTVEVEAFKS